MREGPSIYPWSTPADTESDYVPEKAPFAPCTKLIYVW